MSTIEELTDKIDRFDREQQTKSRFFFRYLVSPLLILIIGYFLNQSVQEAKEQFHRLELEVNQIEAAQTMLADLFSDIPERAFIADRLMSKLVDEELSREISDIIALYYSQRLSRQLSDSTLADAEKIAAAAEAIGGPAAEAIQSQLRERQYYVVVASIQAEQREEAIQRAENLRRKGYNAEVHHSSTGYLAITVGNLPLSEAKALLTRAIAQNDGPEDAYLLPGDTFIQRVYPS